jgi:hypothetical protein
MWPSIGSSFEIEPTDIANLTVLHWLCVCARARAHTHTHTHIYIYIYIYCVKEILDIIYIFHVKEILDMTISQTSFIFTNWHQETVLQISHDTSFVGFPSENFLSSTVPTTQQIAVTPCFTHLSHNWLNWTVRLQRCSVRCTHNKVWPCESSRCHSNCCVVLGVCG